ncbi:hypothetical protein PRIPAC_85237, partial [Pristionchus pacificus]
GMKCMKQQNGGRKRKFFRKSTCAQVLKGLDLSGKVIAVTGTTNGIGIETARSLALAGAHVICLNRNEELSVKAISKVKNEKSSVEMSFIKCDLSSLASVRAAAEELLAKQEKLDVLILNAGIYIPTKRATFDGLETTFGTNHVGHFHLTTLLLPLIKKSTPSRIVVVSSEGHAHTRIKKNATLEAKLNVLIPEVKESMGVTRGTLLYARSKMCNVLFAMKLHRDLQGKGVDVYVLHPGSFIATNIQKNMGIFRYIVYLGVPFAKDLDQGASTTVYCAVHPDTEGISGKYWQSCWDDEKNLDRAFSDDVELQEELWRRTEKIIEDIEKKNE